MARLLAFILMSFVSLSLAAGNVAHAAEPVGCLDTEVAAGLGHADGDGDQIPSDDGKAAPHHHGGCQGHHFGEPVKAGVTHQLQLRGALPMNSDASGHVSAAGDPADRPPQA